jgi:hypothetical protein
MVEAAPPAPSEEPNGDFCGGKGAALDVAFATGAFADDEVARDGLDVARGAVDDAALRTPEPPATPLNSSSSGSRRCA